jgi:hypothetical protein
MADALETAKEMGPQQRSRDTPRLGRAPVDRTCCVGVPEIAFATNINVVVVIFYLNEVPNLIGVRPAPSRRMIKALIC